MKSRPDFVSVAPRYQKYYHSTSNGNINIRPGVLPRTFIIRLQEYEVFSSISCYSIYLLSWITLSLSVIGGKEEAARKLAVDPPPPFCSLGSNHTHPPCATMDRTSESYQETQGYSRLPHFMWPSSFSVVCPPKLHALSAWSSAGWQSDVREPLNVGLSTRQWG